MPNIIQLKNSNTIGRAPAALEQGEVAINSADKQIWVGDPLKNPVALIVKSNLKLRGTFSGTVVGGVLTKSGGSGLAVTRTATGQFSIVSASITSNDMVLVDVFTNHVVETGQLIPGTAAILVYNNGFVGRSLDDPGLLNIMILGE